MLKAVGKYIDTLPLARLFSQEEDSVDQIIIEVDRYYGTHDLSDFTFIMRGITESGGETETELEKEVLESVLHLTWNVNHLFTTEAGTLSLDLLAYAYQNGEAEQHQTTPDYLLRYQLPPVEVRGLPENDHVLEGQSYTNLLIQINETIAALGDISQIYSALSAHQRQLTHHEGVLELLQEEVSSIPEISIMTQAQYDALENPDASVLYILT